MCECANVRILFIRQQKEFAHLHIRIFAHLFPIFAPSKNQVHHGVTSRDRRIAKCWKIDII